MQRNTLGLTLIEVLIALAIIAIAMTAIIKAASQNIRSTSYLRNKTIAMWVGQNVMNETRVGLIKPSTSAQREKTIMLNQDWYWNLHQDETPNKHIKKIIVNVYTQAEVDEQTPPIISLDGYLYVE